MNSRSDLKKQQKIWYAKLRKDGFEDIERDEYNLKYPTTNRFSKSEQDANLEQWKAKRDYYYMAEQFLNTHKFSSKFEEIVWTYHTEGLSCRNIAKVLNKVKKTKTNRTTVWIIVKDLEKLMKRLLWAEIAEEDNEQ